MSSKSILVIEDDSDIRQIIQVCLQVLEGWRISQASSGSEGLAMAEAEQPDAILLDVMMPDMDGLSVLQMLKANAATQKIPVILLTANVQSADQRNYARLELAGVITKPFEPLSLSEQIASILNW